MVSIRQISETDADNFLGLMRQLDEETKFMMYEPRERQTTVEEQTKPVRPDKQTLVPEAKLFGTRSMDKLLKKVLLCVGIVGPLFALAADECPQNGLLLGHNFTPTSYTLPVRRVALGNYAVAYGITDSWTIGTSPWLILAYNMPMLETKIGFCLDSFVQRVSIDVNYFKTFSYRRNLYQQESTLIRVTGSHQFSEAYTLHLSLGHQYFFDNTRPFSLHLISGNGSRSSFNLTTLSEIHVISGLGAFIELGLAGLSYSVPWFQAGLSGFYSWSWGLVQFGYSRTVSLGEGPYYADGLLATVVYWHPEIQIQFLM